MRKLVSRLFVLLALLCVLPSCNFLVSDTEGLLLAPTMNRQQADVYAALESTLDISDIVYRYPQKGDYLSPFIFFDMDGDGLQEAVFFYSLKSEPESTRTKVLKKDTGGRWISICDLSTNSSQVDFVQFSRLVSGTAYCMIIGWKAPESRSGRQANDFLGVYSFNGQDFNTEISSQPYNLYLIRDFDGDGIDEIVTVGQQSGHAFTISLLRSVGSHIDIVDTMPLYAETEAVLQMTCGKLWDGAAALYIDEEWAGAEISTVATEIIKIGRSGLSLLVGGEPPQNNKEIPSWDLFEYTWRDSGTALYCRDFNGDGMVEIPYPESLPGTAVSQTLRLSQLWHLTDKGFDIWQYAMINKDESYLVFYPPKWRDRVTVMADDALNEWKFYLVDSETGETGAELFRVRADSGWKEQDAAGGEFLLESRGNRQYIGYIPLSGETAFEISENEARDMFLLLK